MRETRRTGERHPRGGRIHRDDWKTFSIDRGGKRRSEPSVLARDLVYRERRGEVHLRGYFVRGDVIREKRRRDGNVDGDLKKKDIVPGIKVDKGADVYPGRERRRRRDGYGWDGRVRRTVRGVL